MAKEQNIASRALTGAQNTIGVISRVVKQNLCTGCGICAAICPIGSLAMRLNECGEFVPVLCDECNDCDLCISVCPQLSHNPDNVDVQYIISTKSSDVLGYSHELKTWAGYAVDSSRRLHSASGGMLTLVLQYLLDSQQIDVAIVVGPRNSKTGPLFQAKLVRTPEELDACAGSKYYPVELSKVLHEIKSTKERVAIVGLPCHVSAVRLLIGKSKQLREQIRYIFGLVCGHGVSTKFTELLAAAVRVPLDKVDTVSYRGKEGRLKASDYAFSAFQNDRIIGQPIAFENSPYGVAWCRRLFVPRACDFCTDCFAQDADATFMDAWLPEYIKDPRGASLIVSRTHRVTEILQELSIQGLANLWEVTPDDVVRSQAGVVRYKRELLPDRIFAAISRGKPVPEHLKSFAMRGTQAQRKENNRYERHKRISSFVWRLNLPAKIRLRIIMLLTGPGILKWGNLVLKKMLGARGVLFIKSILVRAKYV
jgi:coenzyme F420-reducing hydrogenase beta subunit